ncbi:MAG: hypothetical protein KF800_17460 [Lysobacter sp.]|nr:hypothetical protein [Lysobacter sp.]
MSADTPLGQAIIEPVQIGIGESAHYKLEQLCVDGYFAEMRDGYRFAVSYALLIGANPERMEGARKTVFSISTIDPEGLLKLAIETLHPIDGEASYKVAERLADWGVSEIDRLFREEFKTVGDLLPSE